MEKNDKSKGAFILIKDEDAAKKLIAAGYEQIPNNIPNVYTFVNIDTSKIFHEIDATKIEYSNLLCM